MGKSVRTKKSGEKRHKRYPIDQCALYQIGSKRRLAKVMGQEVGLLLKLSERSDNYRIFTLRADLSPWSTRRKDRDVQEPKFELRKIHERVFRLLRSVETPNYLYSAVKGRSYIENGKFHVGSLRTLTADIRRFFPATSRARVVDFFVSDLKMASDVAHLLAALCCWGDRLSTGSPLSPLLSFWANKRMFDELDELARARSLRFSCYVDDLTFSGVRLSRGFSAEISTIVQRHGHVLADEKTRFFRRGARPIVTGTIVGPVAVAAPNDRFRKARALKRAIRKADGPTCKLPLVERLNGLVGEAASIEPRFNTWANGIRRQLTTLRRGMSMPRRVAKPRGHYR